MGDEKTVLASGGDTGDMLNDDDYFPFLLLPTELKLAVFDYLDSATVINVLSKVCRYLADIVKEDQIWKVRIHKRWPGKRYPPVDGVGYFDWKAACIKREEEYKKWSCPTTTVHKTNIKFSSAVDAVHITQNNHMVVGLRDHTLACFRLQDIPYKDSSSQRDDNSPPEIPYFEVLGYKLKDSTIFQNSAHKGWVWTIGSDGDKLCSGGWDSKVMLWYNTGEQISTYKCGSAVLSSTINGNEILAGTFNKSLATIDTRQKEPTSLFKVHSKAILCIQTTPNFVIIGSETKLIHILDKKCMRVCNTATLEEGYPRSMSLVGNIMYIGTSKGKIHIFEFNDHRGSLSLVETLEECHAKEVRSVRQTLGSMISASKDGICRIWEPSSSPSIIQSLNMEGEVSAMDYQNDNLALGVAPGNIHLYRDFI